MQAFFNVTATETGCSNVSVVCTPPSGTVVTLWATTNVVCVATDCHSNTASTSFTVTVVPTPPVLQGVNNLVFYSCSTEPVYYSVIMYAPCCEGTYSWPVVCTPPSGVVMAPGTTTNVVCVGGPDCEGLYVTNSFTVTVTPTPLQLNCSPDKDVPYKNWSFDPPQVQAGCCSSYTLTNLPPTTNWSTTPISITEVWQITDSCGRSNSCAQTVYVTNYPAPLSPPSFNLPAAVAWYDSGSNLLAGESVTVTAIGTANVGSPGGNQTPSGSPAGSFNLNSNLFLLPGAPWWSLIGKIGPSGTPFEIGSRTNFTATTGGNLYVSVNDYNFADNSGFWTVWVQAKRPVVNLSNLRVVQRPGSQLFDISYDLQSTVGSPIPVSMRVSTDNGASFSPPVNDVLGNGSGSVTPGNARRFVWDSGTVATGFPLSSVVVQANPANNTPATVTSPLVPPLKIHIPVVEEVTSAYSSSTKQVDFLNSVSLPVEFTATIDWRGSQPGVVQFISPLKQWTDTASGPTVKHTFDVGFDFFPVPGTATGFGANGGGEPGGRTVGRRCLG